MFISLVTMFAALAEPTTAPTPPPADSFAGRPSAHIAFESQVDGFTVKRENNMDILYVEEGLHEWYRAPMTCFGSGDPRDAISLQILGHGFGVDKYTRVYLGGMGLHSGNECTLDNLIKLTDEEEQSLGLEAKRNRNNPNAARAKND